MALIRKGAGEVRSRSAEDQRHDAVICDDEHGVYCVVSAFPPTGISAQAADAVREVVSEQRTRLAEAAAAMAAETTSVNAVKRLLTELFDRGSKAIQERYARPASRVIPRVSCTLAILHRSHVIVAHVGRTRIYLVHKGAIIRLVQKPDDISPGDEEFETTRVALPDRQRRGAEQALGQQEALDPDCIAFRMQPRDRLILVSEAVGDVAYGEQLRALSNLVDEPADVVTGVLEAARAAGGLGDLSCVTVGLSGKEDPQPKAKAKPKPKAKAKAKAKPKPAPKPKPKAKPKPEPEPLSAAEPPVVSATKPPRAPEPTPTPQPGARRESRPTPAPMAMPAPESEPTPIPQPGARRESRPTPAPMAAPPPEPEPEPEPEPAGRRRTSPKTTLPRMPVSDRAPRLTPSPEPTPIPMPKRPKQTGRLAGLLDEEEERRHRQRADTPPHSKHTPLPSGEGRALQAAALRKVPLFGGLSDAQMDLIQGLFSRRALAAAEYLFDEGEPAKQIYIVLTGRLVEERGGEIVAKIPPWHAAGERALLEGELRVTRLRAEKATRVFVIDADELRTHLHRDPVLASRVYHNLAWCVARHIDRLD